MARSREFRKLDQKRATSLTDKGTMVRLAVLTCSRLIAGRGLPMIDSGARQLAFLAGLESHIIEQRRFGESIIGDLIGVVHTLPPSEKMQQRVRVGSQSCVGQTAKGFVIEVMVDPVDLTAGRLFDDAIRAADMVVRALGNYAERHHCAASNRDWNR